MILQVGEAIGGVWTALLLVAASVFGAWLLGVEGRRAWSQFRAALAEGRWPGDEVTQGALVLVGGTLLVTPGFVTDVVGFLLLFGVTRRLVSRVLRRQLGARAGDGPTTDRRGGGTAERGTTARGLDVEVVEIEREPPPRRDPPEGGPGAG